MKKKILITGGAGYIGSHNCVKWLRVNHEVMLFAAPSVAHEPIGAECRKTIEDMFLDI